MKVVELICIPQRLEYFAVKCLARVLRALGSIPGRVLSVT